MRRGLVPLVGVGLLTAGIAGGVLFHSPQVAAQAGGPVLTGLPDSLTVEANVPEGATLEASRFVRKVLENPPPVVTNKTFGDGISLDDDQIAIGATNTDTPPGVIYIYERNLGGPDAWGLSATIPSPFPEVTWGFGFRVDLEGDVLISTTASAGVAVFERNAGGVWEFKQLIPSAGALGLYGAR